MDRRTISIYDTSVAEYEAARTPKHRPGGPGLRGGVPSVPGVADFGCGPGTYLGDLPQPAVALDASGPMLRRARAAVATALPVQADLEALPFVAVRSAVAGPGTPMSMWPRRPCQEPWPSCIRPWPRTAPSPSAC